MEKQLVVDYLKKIIIKKTGNFNYQKTIYIGSKEKNISDYIFYFFAIFSSSGIKKFDILTIFEYLYVDFSSNKYSIYKWMEYNATEKYNIILSDNLFFLMRNDGSGEGDKILSEDLNGKIKMFPIFQNTCMEMLNRTIKYKLAVTSIFLSENDLGAHATTIISFYSKNKIFLYMYDPNGKIKSKGDKSGVLLNCIKNMISHNLQYKLNVEIIEDNFYGYNIGYGIQNMTNMLIKKKYILQGYCIIYNVFFVKCLLETYYYYKENNLEIDPQEIINLVVNFIGDINLFFEGDFEKFYNFLVFFTNDIRENYLIFISDNYPDEKSKFLRYLNEKILESVGQTVEEKETLEVETLEEKETRDLDSELESLNLYPPGKRSEEACNEDEECASKECKNNKCLPIPFNKKLDLLMKYEWEESNNRDLENYTEEEF